MDAFIFELLIKRVNVLIIHKHIHQTKQSQFILRHHQYALLYVDIAKYDNLYEDLNVVENSITRYLDIKNF